MFWNKNTIILFFFYFSVVTSHYPHSRTVDILLHRTRFLLLDLECPATHICISLATYVHIYICILPVYLHFDLALEFCRLIYDLFSLGILWRRSVQYEALPLFSQILFPVQLFLVHMSPVLLFGILFLRSHWKAVFYLYSSDLYDLALYTFYSYYAVNFFVIIGSNKVIRNEALLYLNLKKKTAEQGRTSFFKTRTNLLKFRCRSMFYGTYPGSVHL
jgi:hypothetical protein